MTVCRRNYFRIVRGSLEEQPNVSIVITAATENDKKTMRCTEVLDGVVGVRRKELPGGLVEACMGVGE